MATVSPQCTLLGLAEQYCPGTASATGIVLAAGAQGAFGEAIYGVCNRILAFLLCFCK